ncbi:alpha-galactosidase [Companilactobacillus kimchiensis]|uniref:Alpha-galactosidase n=1 Tax=Companilactobacillus kimchiensis TaxID=993692 RepID=A0A0R2LC87_9LACO|nr:alpha-galactosidase [Companilactobacillus kimchiensis]KRN97366.1 Alpha-galactosidase [Companilactobacillus kimchiensis]
MPVEFDKTNGLINLHNKNISYIIQILDHKYPVHRYFGRFIQNYHDNHDLPQGNHAFAVDVTPEFPYSITSLPLEYSTIGSGDYRLPSFLIKDSDNQLLPLLEYSSMTITHKPINPTQLPKSVTKNSPVSTLILHLKDPQTNLEMDLNYTIFEEENLILRSTTLKNSGTSVLMISAAASAQLDLPTNDYSTLTFSGTHAHEANPTLVPLHTGIQMQHTFRGTSGPQQQPFVALANPNTTEFNGEIISCALIWSGNFESAIEVDQYQHTRLKIGLESTTFNWQLLPGSSFQTPEAILTWSNSGFNGMSQILHNFGNQLKPLPRTKETIALNTWESMFFDVSEKKVENFIQQALPLGINMIVLDDGWFVNRHSEDGQLGDWQYDSHKFPHGLEPLVKQAHRLKMKFGLWVEPEMITENSQLYSKHPEWTLNYKNRQPITARHQLVLDLSQLKVRQHLLTTLLNLVQDNHLDYLKWDMNRHLTQVGNAWLPAEQQDELYYRYVIGLYDLLKKLRQACPNLIIENCSAGGGRLDFGMMAYTDQTWLSDLTDPIDRAKIENGFSYLFPQNIFSNHASASPNGQNGRQTTLQSRLQLASIGQMGFELDLNTLTENDKTLIKQQILKYQNWWSPAFNNAAFYRLTQIGDDTKVTWLLVTNDKKQALIFYSYGISSAVKRITTLPLHYLDDQATYHSLNNETFSGAELNSIGLTIPPVQNDFETQLIWLGQN